MATQLAARTRARHLRDGRTHGGSAKNVVKQEVYGAQHGGEFAKDQKCVKEASPGDRELACKLAVADSGEGGGAGGEQQGQHHGRACDERVDEGKEREDACGDDSSYSHHCTAGVRTKGGSRGERSRDALQKAAAPRLFFR